MCQRSNNFFPVKVFTVPTKGGDSATQTTQKKMIDTSLLNEEDLQTLKRQDPFLYYSIPAVLTATQLRRDVDMSRLNGGMSSLKVSYPSRIGSASSNTSTTVERKSRISFECHTDAIMEGLIDDMDDWTVPPRLEKK